MRYFALFVCSLLPLFSHFADDFQTFRADFTQTVHGEAGANKAVYKGKLIASIDSRAKWTYIHPMRKEVYISGSQVTVYDRMIHEVLFMHSQDKLDFIALLRHLQPLGDGTYVGSFGGTEYTLSFRDELPSNLKYKDDFGNEVVIDLSSVVINSELDDAEFKIDIPPGASVIRAD